MAKKEKNSVPQYAEDAEFAQAFVADVISDWRNLCTERATREEIWTDSYSAWSADESDPRSMRGYAGRANVSLPQIRKEVETMSRRLVKALFPEDYLKAEALDIANDDLTQINTQVVRHFFDNVMGMQAKAYPWIKQGVLYGTSPIREFWKKETNEVLYKKRYFKEDERGNLVPDFKRVKEEVTVYDGPAVQTCDIFQTWVYPSTATYPDEIKRVYFRTKVSFEELKKYEANGLTVSVDFLKDEAKKRDRQFEQTESRFAALGDTATLHGEGEDGYFDLLEVWGRREIEGKIIPYVAWIINETHAVRIQQNPLWHQSFPFHFMRYIIPPGNEFYGRGLPEASLPAQHQLNDVLNQGLDSATLSLQAITVINPAYAPNADSFEVEPRAIWWADPNAVKQLTFPDLSDVSLKNAGSLRSIITEMSDNSPQLPDPIAGKARSTGQAQLAINEWQTDLYMFVNHIAVEALNPLAAQTHALLQQHLPDESIIRISGKYAGKWVNRVVTPADVVGRYDFKWIGAIQVENQSVKTQQMLNFLKIFPMIPPDSGVKINWENLMIKLMRDGFQIRDVQNIVETDNLNASVPPAIENKLLGMGADVQVTKTDDDELHTQEHNYLLSKTTDKYTRAKIQQHLTQHKAQLDRKNAQIQAQAAMMAQQQVMGMMQGPGKPPKNPMSKGPMNGGPNPMGNQGQLSQTTDGADLERGLGV